MDGGRGLGLAADHVVEATGVAVGGNVAAAGEAGTVSILLVWPYLR